MIPFPTLDAARDILRRVYGHADFRGRQAEVLAELLAGRDALAVLPTGGGKSVCYQIPAILRPGVGLVVSPLIALMSDQVSGLKQLGVAAERLDSSTSLNARSEIWARLRAGEIDLLYLSPEGLMQPALLDRLAEIPLSLIAVDEAHCVSAWGHDFRPEYRALGRLAELFPGVPRLAVTATADARTRADIKASLRLEGAAEIVASFDRPNLILSAERKTGAGTKRVVELVTARRGRAGVVYCGSREGTERTAEALRDAGVPALAYHAGLDPAERESRLQRFLNEDDVVMAATIAFGMGVDKPDVRFVVHADPPASIEAYWQEVGRAGRDGDSAEGIALYGSADYAWAIRRIESREVSDEVKAVQIGKARKLYALFDGVVCRPASVRRYFGEEGVEPCGRCDVCVEAPQAVDRTQAAQKALSAVHRLGQRFGRGRVVDHLTGRTKDPTDWEVGLSTWGIGADLDPNAWRDVLDALLFEGLLREDPNDGRPVLTLGDGAEVKALYRSERQVRVREPAARDSARKPRQRGARGPVAAVPEAARPLFEALKAWRKDRAAEQGVPPYVVFHDRTLLDVAAGRPSSLYELGRVGGVGEGKLARYGEAVLKVVREN